MLTRFEKWVLRKLIRRHAREGMQKHVVVAVMQYTRDVITELYCEDNVPTTDAFMMHCFDQTQKSIWWEDLIRVPLSHYWK
jgi:hypothetical protein